MSNKYEKLDSFLDRAFSGSPNTLSANEMKVEIANNLRQMYDELLAEGLSEDEALAKTCDSLGNLSELFGENRTSDGDYYTTAGSAPNQSTNVGTNYAYSQPPHPTRTPKPPASPLRSLIITIGVLCCAFCWLPTAMLAISGVGESWIASPVLLMVSLGVFCFIYAGSMRIGASALHKLHYALIGLGVGCEISCAVPTIIMIEHENIAVCLLLSLVAIGIVLIVGGVFVPVDKWDKDGYDPAENRPQTPLEKSISLIVLAVYLLVSIITGAWAVTWIIFLIGSAVKTLVRSCLELNELDKNDPKV